MAPSAIVAPAVTEQDVPIVTKGRPQPLASSGLLDQFEQFDVTPVIGTEFSSANLVELVVSQRGVVFFRAQDDLTNDIQKVLVQRLGELTGKPITSGLHIHPVLNPSQEFGGTDPEISTISSAQHKKRYSVAPGEKLTAKPPSAEYWHSDIAFEPVPADYSSLRLIELPRTGGDTLWASGYELYDRISEPYQKFLDGLTGTFAQPGLTAAAARGDVKVYDKLRGAPENDGSSFKAVHPVVRTNPVTGWKSLFPVGDHIHHINGVTEEESKSLLSWFLDLVYKNHDLQVRFQWKNPNDIAIWDNRSTFHRATFDYDGQGERFGNRAVGVGERPYFDPNSKSRREALREHAPGEKIQV
ncbi:alpha-ketoglutarate-dependent taurine dioxygenase [Eremomyces bilateralis CBS 781.70]|uniref:Alpha-ketoglutarate-dependent taurine dioxygenase n=1 Tax=Eremomyces bilateralis CBS 781.70 TaxID=1392243 RepID=A0A6G1FWE4_9PEZI|nr:alpha-ketoglutarate-dependent taurine dioxygenase [Eremomyces bilateralis CBS 781.70]KAF1810157.1 alpha-ketoglutarate-dependent taurine dioxygenase [Eremomyces bilateralis CBS 781.70]